MQKTGYILTLLTLLTIMLANSAVFAQNETVQNDTTINNTPLKAPLLDSTLLHTSIFTLLESPDTGNGKITVKQSLKVKRIWINGIQTYNIKKKNGYGIRIVVDNAECARYRAEYI